jgi:ABC-2 type transport system permease protein
MNALGDVVSWLGSARIVSPFYQYIGHDPLRHGISWPAVLVAVGTATILVVIAIESFERRDIAG